MNISAFLSVIPVMLKGMGGIFIVTGVIIIFISILRRLTKDIK